LRFRPILVGVNVPTDRRAVVRVLLRLGTPYAGSPAARKLGGYTVMVVGEAKAADWQAYRAGDLEGVVWTTHRQVAQVVQNLRGLDGIADAKGEGDDGP
jgi:hypothetical protein